MDTFILQAIIDECKPLNGTSIVAIEQYGPTEIGLVLKTTSGRKVLFLSVHPIFARVYLSDPSIKPTGSSPLLTSLREHLVPGILSEVKMVPFERILEIQCKGRSSSGLQHYRLMVEFIGNRSILVFITEPDLMILATLRRIRRANQSLGRGKNYILPTPLNCPPLVEATPGLLIDSFSSTIPANNAKILASKFGDLSRQVAIEILAHARLDKEKNRGDIGKSRLLENLWKSIEKLVLRVKNRKWTPCIGRTPNGQVCILSAVPIFSLPDTQIQTYRSMSCAVESFYNQHISDEQTKSLAKTLQRTIGDEIKRLERLETNLKFDLKNMEREEEFRRYGNLITSNLKQLKNGIMEAKVTDYYSASQKIITIPLKLTLSPAENAQWYFRQARKTRDGRKMVTNRLKHTQERLSEIEKVFMLFQKDPDHLKLKDISLLCTKLELIKDPGVISPSKKLRRRTQNKLNPRKYLTSEGHLLLVGRNSRENETLSKSAAPNDIWLHARNLAGSHVILKRVDKTQMPSKKSLYEAACLTAYFSKGRGSTTVPVDYTERRYVRKTKNGAPGQVIFTHEKTLFVEPKLELKHAIPSNVSTEE